MALAFAGNPLFRLEQIRRDDGWIRNRAEAADSRFLLYSDLKPLVRDGRLHWVGRDGVPAGHRFMALLGLDGDVACFAVDANGAPPPDGAEYVEARAAAMHLSAAESAVMGQGRSLIDWHARHGFCAVCGAPTYVIRGGGARRCSRPTCNAEHYPRVDPVVIMLAVHGDRCLMGRQPGFPPGMYSALAGFMEPGETIEEAVMREFMEEAGLRVRSVTYALSQPWPFPSSLMIGCFAAADDDRITADQTELEDLRWFSRAEVADAFANKDPSRLMVPPDIAVAHHLLRRWLEGEGPQD